MITNIIMQCQCCGSAATTLLRNSFSLQRVAMNGSFSGYLRCRHCGKQLLNRDYVDLYRFAPLAFIATFLSDSVFTPFSETGLILPWNIIITAVLERADDPDDDLEYAHHRRGVL